MIQYVIIITHYNMFDIVYGKCSCASRATRISDNGHIVYLIMRLSGFGVLHWLALGIVTRYIYNQCTTAAHLGTCKFHRFIRKNQTI